MEVKNETGAMTFQLARSISLFIIIDYSKQKPQTKYGMRLFNLGKNPKKAENKRFEFITILFES
jgi:hypothetical protein